ncbi:FHA domain-containing protein FhaB/FipA [Aquihabitans sp. McL0605]|uniref:FHA domain-containing protein FhaB/FipA n=1 Tax=Aquihabitans sp. McL0605 TaxID=3415671 RepID=UPI003CFADFBA
MDEQLLTILKLCLLALLYLFFFRVLRAVWAEIRGPKAVAVPARQAAAPPKPSKRAERAAAPVQLAIVEPASLRGRTYPLGEELTVGRAAGCQVTIDDTYASQIHARVFNRQGQLFVEDLGSTNGTYLNRQKVQGPQVMRRGDRLQVGNTVLELV